MCDEGNEIFWFSEKKEYSVIQKLMTLHYAVNESIIRVVVVFNAFLLLKILKRE